MSELKLDKLIYFRVEGKEIIPPPPPLQWTTDKAEEHNNLVENWREIAPWLDYNLKIKVCFKDKICPSMSYT